MQMVVNQGRPESQPAVQPASNNNNNAPARRQFDNSSLIPTVGSSTLSSGAPVVQPGVPQIEQPLASDVPPADVTQAKEDEMKEGEMIKPENPVPLATVTFGQDSEVRRIKMEQMRKDFEAEQKKSG